MPSAQAVVGQQRDAGLERVGRALEAHLAALDPHHPTLAALSGTAEQRLGKLGEAGAGEPGDAQDLAMAQVKVTPRGPLRTERLSTARSGSPAEAISGRRVWVASERPSMAATASGRLVSALAFAGSPRRRAAR